MVGHVIVLGSLNMDIVVSVKRHPAPGETIMGSDVQYYPGGKGLNQAVSAARMGAHVSMIGAVGNDEFGERLLSFLHAETVDVGAVVKIDDTPSGTALITVDAEGENSIVVVPGANAQLQLPKQFISAPTIIAQFETPLALTEQAFASVKKSGGRTILNPSPFQAVPETLLAHCDIVIVNEHELAQMAESAQSDDPEMVAKAVRSLNSPGRYCIVTLGPKGCLVDDDGNVTHILGESVTAVDTTGAGDCFAGVFAAKLAQGVSFTCAARWANTAAALSTTRHGAAPAMPTFEQAKQFWNATQDEEGDDEQA